MGDDRQKRTEKGNHPNFNPGKFESKQGWSRKAHYEYRISLC
jgi:hypothetical protein